MSSLSLINKVKQSPWLYNAYFHVGSFLVNILKILLKPDDKLMLFVSYGGKKFDDSPKDIYETMLKDRRYDDFEKVWAFRQPDNFDIGGGKKIKIDTLEYYKTALKARVWIANVGVTRALSFKGINTISVNSWHGTPIKKIGRDAKKEKTFVGKGEPIDIQLAQGDYEVERYSQAFNLLKENVKKTGLPRNDTLVTNNTPENIARLKKKMGLPLDKKIILYGPTYRDYDVESWSGYVMKPPFDLERWKKELGNDYILLVRAHIAVVKEINLRENDFVRDFSKYPILNDVLLVSDILISDYSGILFDYAILGRPMFCYTYDYDKYNKMRGMYFDIRRELSYSENEDNMIDIIRNINWAEETEKAMKFRDKYVQEYGNASEKVLDIIYDRIKVKA